MNSNNTVTIISNNAKIIEEISSKLVLLRDFDKVESVNTIDAFEFVKNELPHVIILHAIFDDTKRLDLLRQIKNEKSLKNTAVIMLAENCNEEFLVEAYDLGVADFIGYPFKNAELLLRVMWGVRKSEMLENIDFKADFLTNLGIMELNTGFYSKKYCEEFLNNEIEYAIKHKETACVMLVEAEKMTNNKVLSFSQIVKKSIRLNDNVGVLGKNKFYIFLPKTKLNGVYSVFERMKTKGANDYKISASVIETRDKSFSKIQPILDDALKETNKESTSLIVASNTVKLDESENENVAVFGHKNNPKIDNETINSELTKQLQKIKSEIKTILPKEINADEFEKLKMQVDFEKAKTEKKKIKTVSEKEKLEIEERNAVVYKQAYERKCMLVIEPVFKKYKTLLTEKNKYVYVDFKIDFNQSYFKVVKGANELVVALEYKGYSDIKVDTVHIFNGRMRDNKSTKIELVKFDRHAFDSLFQKLMQNIK